MLISTSVLFPSERQWLVKLCCVSRHENSQLNSYTGIFSTRAASAVVTFMIPERYCSRKSAGYP